VAAIEGDGEGLLAGALDLLVEKVAADERALGVAFPYVTGPDGAWRTMLASQSAGYGPGGWSHGNWFCGFWVGLLLIAHLKSGRDDLLDLARERMRLVAQRADDPNTHDIGFIFLSSAAPGFHITGDPWWREIGLRAAARLRARLVTTPEGAWLAAWGPLSDPRGRKSSAIDTMANLPLLYWAAEVAGDASHRLAAHAHALMTAKAFIRPDHSTFHAVEYDLATGRRARGFTFQGHGDESFWSRGQAWAVLGEVATARATGLAHHLDLAQRLAEVFLARQGAAAVPPWDFDDPAGDAATRDSAAGAILANALLDLAALHPDETRGAVWRERAIRLLLGLTATCLARDPGHRGLLRHGCYSRPHDDGTDSAVLFGDYYYAEALARLLLPGRFLPEPVRLG
jgi:unsaturated chondroitin disaccharide hydrolase